MLPFPVSQKIPALLCKRKVEELLCEIKNTLCLLFLYLPPQPRPPPRLEPTFAAALEGTKAPTFLCQCAQQIVCWQLTLFQISQCFLHISLMHSMHCIQTHFLHTNTFIWCTQIFLWCIQTLQSRGRFLVSVVVFAFCYLQQDLFTN